VSVQKVFLCPLLGQPRQSGVSLESPGLENIPPVPGNGAELGQNHDGLKTVSAEVGLCVRPEARTRALKKVSCVHFTAKLDHQELV